ncbi:hypothetical protein [Sphingomonas sp.]|uniref:hypothetical protein n=1 Tax=Sphingomonas sp. TaxID=28214 RepID=UPI003D6D7C01
MKEACPICTRMIQIDQRQCSYCFSDIGFPNVRYAMRAEECTALEHRLAAAQKVIEEANLQYEYDLLLFMTEKSKLVINRKFRQLSHWLYSENRLYRNFYKRRQSGESYTEDEFNLQRISAENTVSPLFYDQLNYAAITVDGVGMPYYGEYSIIVREDAIAHRTTVFEENPFIFSERHGIVSGKMPPPGYRTVWDRRAKLIAAKLAERLSKGACDADIAELVMNRNRGAATCDFVEAHVYGDILLDCIETVVGPKPASRPDRIAWRHMRQLLVELGADVMEAP